MASPRVKSTESKWAEVRLINGYALFMGFLSMSVRGLGFLVITWTTVVLLGGFVSMLDKKDFWCLTLITLIQITVIQTAGIFDVRTGEKLRYIKKSCQGFYDTMRMMVRRKEDSGNIYEEGEGYVEQEEQDQGHFANQGVHEGSNQESSITGRQFSDIARHVVTFVVAFPQVLVFSIILCPLGALYACGLEISGGISLWRLIQHDYGSTDGDPSKVNMNPALDVLYGLALVQSALFSYSMILLLARGKVEKAVAEVYGFQGDALKSVSDYLVATRTGLAKDPSLSMGRNLITYAVKLMESESADDDRSGIMILSTIIKYAKKEKDAIPAAVDEYLCGIKIPKINRRQQEPPLPPRKENKGQDMLLLIERLLGSPSSSNIFHKLLKALGPRSPHRANDIEIRVSSARIVAHLAGNIRLNHFPRGMECISSLFDSSGQHEVDGYKDLVLQGLLIFGKLATDQENCRVMGRANGLVSTIMKPVSSDLLHNVDHPTWAKIVDASLEAMYNLLTTAPTDIAPELGEEVSNNNEAIRSMHTILGCKDCGEDRHMLAMKILTALPTEIEGDVTGGVFIDRAKITGTLASIFSDKSKDRRIRELAGERLVKLSSQSPLSKKKSSQSQVIALLQEDCNLVGTLTKLLLEDRVNKCRISAAGILEVLCSQYWDAECFQQFKNGVTKVMPKVLRQIFCAELRQAQVVGPYFGYLVSDIEGQNSEASRGNGQKDGQQEEDKILQVALLSLYVTVHEKLNNTDQDSDLAIIDDAFNFMGELEDMTRRNGNPKVTGCLRTLKLISKMAISMMIQRKPRYIDVVRRMEDLIGALGSAAQSMLGLDGFVLITGRDDGETLVTLVERARGGLVKTKREAA